MYKKGPDFMRYFIFFLSDIMLGYVLQAIGCTICLFDVTNQDFRSRKFWLTTLIFSAIAFVIRMAYNLKFIDFGFHTVIIWILFILVAIGFNKLPVMQSVGSILLSGVLITVAELITAMVLILTYGNEKFDSLMNNTATLEGATTKAVLGIPANILFVLIVSLIYFIRLRMRKKKLVAETQANVEQN